jgi:hypothetical protein
MFWSIPDQPFTRLPSKPMVWLAIVLFLALAIAMFRGGRLSNLADIRLRAWMLLVVGVLLQIGTRFLPDEPWADTVGVSMVLVSFGLLLAMVVLNRKEPGMWLAGIGILMNFTVIALNGGMPVLSEAAEVASGFTVANPDVAGSFKHVRLDESSRLAFLADVIPLRLGSMGTVISLGDVFLAVGLGRYLEAELRRPRRWFRRGASAEPGSAAGG